MERGEGEHGDGPDEAGRLNGRGAAKRHPIGVVARRTGLSRHLLRAWERRFDVVRPGRGARDRRLYSDEDVRHLALLRDATRGGRSIGEVAGLSVEELESLVREDHRAVEVGWPSERYVDEALTAATDLDTVRLNRTLARAVAALGPVTAVEEVLAPLMRRIGTAWEAGELRAGHEHVASAAARRVLSDLLVDLQPADRSAPTVVAAAPAGQHHELGALMAGVAAAASGWRVAYLGADLPAAEIAVAARRTGARAVALSLVFPAADPSTERELESLAAALPEDVVLLTGGSGAGDYAPTLGRIGAHILPDTRTLVGALHRIAPSDATD